MNENILEQPEVAPVDGDADASKFEKLEDTSSKLERFASVEDLQTAYKHLRAEFTRKSQKLSELLHAASEKPDAGAAQNDGANSPSATETQKHGTSEHKPEVIEPTAPRGVTPEKVIEEYLISLGRGKTAPAVIANTNNDFIVTRGQEIKSINTSTKIAEQFFKTRQL